MRELIGQCEGNIRELQQLQVSALCPRHAIPDVQRCCPSGDTVMFAALQNEKCHLLMENETQKLKMLDEKHNQLMKDWRDHLKPRKKVGVA